MEPPLAQTTSRAVFHREARPAAVARPHPPAAWNLTQTGPCKCLFSPRRPPRRVETAGGQWGGRPYGTGRVYFPFAARRIPAAPCHWRGATRQGCRHVQLRCRGWVLDSRADGDGWASWRSSPWTGPSIGPEGFMMADGGRGGWWFGSRLRPGWFGLRPGRRWGEIEGERACRCLLCASPGHVMECSLFRFRWLACWSCNCRCLDLAVRMNAASLSTSQSCALWPLRAAYIWDRGAGFLAPTHGPWLVWPWPAFR